MSSSLFILDEDLEPLVSKNIRALPNLSSVLSSFKQCYHDSSPPILFQNDWFFIHLKRDYLHFVSVIHTTDKPNIDLMTILAFLEQFYHLLQKYFEIEVLTKNVILDNVLLVLELMDECMDFGIVQVTDPSIIKDYIRVKVNLPEVVVDNHEWSSDGESSSCNSRSSENEYSRKSSKKKKKKKKKGCKGKGTGRSKIKSIMINNKENKGVNVMETVKETLRNKSDTGKEPLDEELPNDGNDLYFNGDIAKTIIMPISWRTKGIHYAKNEFFLDVIERVQYLMDFEKGIIRKNLIHGEIFCRSYLSGMPKLKISINKILNRDPQFMSNSNFHQCVSLDSINTMEREDEDEDEEANSADSQVAATKAREIEFVPPDGEFVLCQYELKRHVKDAPMIKLKEFEIKPKLKKFKIQIITKIQTNFKPTNSTSKLNVKIPLAKLFRDYKIDLSKQIRFKANIGKVVFNLSDDFLLWEIQTMKGHRNNNNNNNNNSSQEDDPDTCASMVAEFSIFNQEEYDRLQEELKTSMNPPPLRTGPKLEELYRQVHDKHAAHVTPQDKLVAIEFEIPYCTCSGLKVEYLKVEEPQLQYQSFPWVRYKTISDEEYAYIV
ncbi:apm2p [Saccharomyces arboricola H-6]|uniref:Apm2p n=1 Tax=Saccharomyces arboricola (strain H-6 / AS 2.3317 / CBS 10644) TaxID=1160507 RepID=J8PN29_SACAR|nr:apm2p [Saccharomyces arboricola H-6]